MYHSVIVNGKYMIVFQTKKMAMPRYSEANFHLKLFSGVPKRRSYSGKSYVNIVVNFLNYLILAFDYKYDDKPNQLRYIHAQHYLNYYAITVNSKGDNPSNKAIEEQRYHITTFLQNLKDDKVCPDLDQHYLRRNISNNTRKTIWQYELIITRNSNESSSEVYRFCPKYFVDEYLKQARLHNPELFILGALQIDAGLRPSCACNVRTMQSSYGPGYKKVLDPEGNLLALKIDLKKSPYDRPLRDDGVKVGGIKKPREIDVYPPNVHHLNQAIESYLAYTSDRKRESSEPLVVSRYHRGGKYNRCYTYDTYIKAFHSLCDEYVIPALLAKGGTEAAYAEKLDEAGCFYGPHFFREFFTCQLVEDGMSWDLVMHFRGDKSEESAINYVLKGGKIQEIAMETGEVIAEYLISGGNKNGALRLPRANI